MAGAMTGVEYVMHETTVPPQGLRFYKKPRDVLHIGALILNIITLRLLSRSQYEYFRADRSCTDMQSCTGPLMVI